MSLRIPYGWASLVLAVVFLVCAPFFFFSRITLHGNPYASSGIKFALALFSLVMSHWLYRRYLSLQAGVQPIADPDRDWIRVSRSLGGVCGILAAIGFVVALLSLSQRLVTLWLASSLFVLTPACIFVVHLNGGASTATSARRRSMPAFVGWASGAIAAAALALAILDFSHSSRFVPPIIGMIGLIVSIVCGIVFGVFLRGKYRTTHQDNTQPPAMKATMVNRLVRLPLKTRIGVPVVVIAFIAGLLFIPHEVRSPEGNLRRQYATASVSVSVALAVLTTLTAMRQQAPSRQQWAHIALAAAVIAVGALLMLTNRPAWSFTQHDRYFIGLFLAGLGALRLMAIAVRHQLRLQTPH